MHERDLPLRGRRRGAWALALGLGAAPSLHAQPRPRSGACRDAGRRLESALELRERALEAAALEVLTDVPRDTGFDVPRDTGFDVPRDTGTDLGRDTGIDVGVDADTDLGRDTGADTGPDTGPDIPCGAGLTRCGPSCVDLSLNGNHCGACDTRCTSVPGASVTCMAGACRATCLSTRGDCNDDLSDGCETVLSSSVSHCGACGQACSTHHVTPSCIAGQCRSTACDPGFADCDREAATGCEVDLQSAPLHCGSCARACGQTIPCTEDAECGGTPCLMRACVGLGRACSAGMCVLCGALDAPCCAADGCAAGLRCADVDGGLRRCVP